LNQKHKEVNQGLLRTWIIALVSTNKLSQKLAFGIAAHGLVTLAKQAYTHPTYDITHK